VVNITAGRVLSMVCNGHRFCHMMHSLFNFHHQVYGWKHAGETVLSCTDLLRLKSPGLDGIDLAWADQDAIHNCR
jgi:hypothetical protein